MRLILMTLVVAGSFSLAPLSLGQQVASLSTSLPSEAARVKSPAQTWCDDQVPKTIAMELELANTLPAKERDARRTEVASQDYKDSAMQFCVVIPPEYDAYTKEQQAKLMADSTRSGRRR